MALSIFSGIAKAAPVPGADFSAGLSPSFITNFKNLSGASAADASVRDAISKMQKDMQLGFTRLDLHAPVLSMQSDSWPQYFSFGLSGEGAGLLASIAPGQVSSSRIFSGMVRGMFDGPVAKDLYLSTSVLLGVGSEKQQLYVDNGSSVSFGSRDAISLLAGADLQLQKTWHIGQRLRLINTLQTQETMFKAVSPNISGAVNLPLQDWSHDWLFRNDLIYSIFDLHVMAGAHPYASALLPRVWNRIARVPSGAKFSAGIGATKGLGHMLEGAVLAGIYAGKLGGEIRFQLPEKFNARFSTYGIAENTGFSTFTQRAYSFALDLMI